MQVTYDANVCIHAGNCVKSLPAVFKVVDGQFVIDHQGASEAAIRQTLDHFAMTAANGEVAVQKEFPGISASLLEGLRGIYNQNEQIKARPSYGAASITGNRAELAYSIRLNYQDRNSKQPGTFLFRFRALLSKRNGKWELTELAPPSA